MSFREEDLENFHKEVDSVKKARKGADPERPVTVPRQFKPLDSRIAPRPPVFGPDDIRKTYVGQMLNCVDCGIEFERKSAVHKRCDKCGRRNKNNV